MSSKTPTDRHPVIASDLDYLLPPFRYMAPSMIRGAVHYSISAANTQERSSVQVSKLSRLFTASVSPADWLPFLYRTCRPKATILEMLVAMIRHELSFPSCWPAAACSRLNIMCSDARYCQANCQRLKDSVSVLFHSPSSSSSNLF